MGALNQLGSAATSFVQDPIGSTSNALAQADKDLSLSKNAVPIAALAALAASGGLSGLGVPGLGAAGAGAAGAGAADLAAAYGATGAGVGAGTAAGIGAGAASLLGSAGSAAGNFLSNLTPTQALLGAGLAAKALGGSSSTPSSSTTSTSIDPDIKAAYLQQLADARTAAAGLGTRQFEGFTPGYATAEQQLTATGIGGADVGCGFKHPVPCHIHEIHIIAGPAQHGIGPGFGPSFKVFRQVHQVNTRDIAASHQFLGACTVV